MRRTSRSREDEDVAMRRTSRGGCCEEEDIAKSRGGGLGCEEDDIARKSHGEEETSKEIYKIGDLE